MLSSDADALACQHAALALQALLGRHAKEEALIPSNADPVIIVGNVHRLSVDVLAERLRVDRAVVLGWCVGARVRASLTPLLPPTNPPSSDQPPRSFSAPADRLLLRRSTEPAARARMRRRACWSLHAHLVWRRQRVHGRRFRQAQAWAHRDVATSLASAVTNLRPSQRLNGNKELRCAYTPYTLNPKQGAQVRLNTLHPKP